MQAEQWEAAYLAQSQDAAVGRMFRGIIHNLNGMVQVFSLQTELFELMVAKALEMLARMQESQPGSEAAALYELIGRRTSSLAQMKEKVVQSQNLLHRTLILPDFSQLSGVSPYTVNTVVETELEFLCADNFFKHKVEKKVTLAEDAPALASHHLELHQIVHFVLQNALDALRERDEARLAVEILRVEAGIVVRVEDNGPGIDPAVLPRIYEPFFSTREGHFGLGLYLALDLAGRCGVAISCESSPGCTSFQLLLPSQAARG